MIPATNGYLHLDFEVTELPSDTFKMNTDSKMIAGWIDGIEAVKQAIFLILNVERYEHLIHSWNYGVELSDLMGMPISFCLPEIKRRITEALLQDSRITQVDNFNFEVDRGKVYTIFEVTTIFGTLEAERVVKI